MTDDNAVSDQFDMDAINAKVDEMTAEQRAAALAEAESVAIGLDSIQLGDECSARGDLRSAARWYAVAARHGADGADELLTETETRIEATAAGSIADGADEADALVPALRHILSQNTTLTDILAHAAELDLPGWYLTAGCIFQTVWNVVTGHEPTHGILDYDLFYFDGTDLSWEAEDAVIKRGRAAFAVIPADVEIRNEARVHLWYEQKYGVPCEPYTSTEAAIDSFAATACCVGIRAEPSGRWRTYAPHGLSDMFNLIVRPNPIQATREVYETKTRRWRRQWPALTVLPWPGVP